MLLLLAACRPPASPVAPPARSDALWFVLVDRFADGAPDAPGMVDRADPAAWHGGDLRGLIDHLDHLSALGVGGVWVSPLADTRDEPIGGWGAFHGYWTVDPAVVEPRLGTEEDVVALREALDDRGMELWLDVVWNHVGYDAPVLKEHPEWFHGLGDVADWGDPVQVVRHDVHGLPDLAQEQEEVYAWLRDGALRWMELARPDGLRVDAVRHLEPGFVRRIGADLRRRDRSLRLLGEVFDGDGGAVAASAEREHLDEVFDFPLHYTLVQSVCGDAPLGKVAGVLSPTLGGAVPVGMLDNHDLPRIASACGGSEGAARALAVLLTTRGRPALTWGTEIPIVGAGEPENRADQPWGREGELTPLIRGLLALRGELPFLRDGWTRTIWLDDDRWLFARGDATRTVVVAVNRRNEAWTPPLPFPSAPRRTLLVDGTRLLEGRTDVPADSVWIGVWDGPPEWETGSATLRLLVRGAPPGEVRWVGATAALDGWSPERGRPAGGWQCGTPNVCATGPRVGSGDSMLELEVPWGTVLVGKPVVIGPEGDVSWDPGPDRIRLAASSVAPGGCGSRCVGDPVTWGQP